MNPIKQYLKEREEEFDEKFRFTSKEYVREGWLSVKVGQEERHSVVNASSQDIKSFYSETIKGLIERLVKEEKLKEIISLSPSGTPLDGMLLNLEKQCRVLGYNQAKQETTDRLLELIK